MKNGPYTLVVAPPGYPGKKYRGRYCYEHRLVFWQLHGYLPETVHHDNEVKRDNAPDNLKPMERPAHAAHHHTPVTMVKYVCDNCGRDFERRKHGKFHRFCSRRCIGLFNFPTRMVDGRADRRSTVNGEQAGSIPALPANL